MLKSKISRAGFTLVEILIAMSIASIVLVAASRLLMSVLNQYTKDNSDIQLQTEVEEILNLMENIIMEADGVTILNDTSNVSDQGLSEGPVLRVDQTETADDGTTSEVYYLIFQENNNAYESKYQYDESGDTWENVGSREKIYMGTNVASIYFTMAESETAVFVDVSMENGGATYDASRKMLLRNLTSDYQNAKGTTTTAATTTAAGSTTAADATTAATTTAEETTEETTEETETTTIDENTLDENKVVVTSSTINNSGSYYTISVTLKNNGKTVSWGDLSFSYYYNCPERYNFTVELVSASLSDTSASEVVCTIGNPVELTTTYTDAVGYVPISFSSADDPGLGYGETITVTFIAGNKKSDGSWGSLFESTNNASHLLTTSHSTSIENVVVYCDGTQAYGTLPSETASLNENDVTITSQTVNTDDSTKYQISFTLKNNGQPVDWDNLELQYFYIVPSGEDITPEITCSSSEIDSITLSWEKCELSGGTYANASKYISFKLDADGQFYTDEAITISFYASYSNGASDLNGSGNAKAFANSHSLKSANYIGLYLDGTLLDGYVAPETIDTSSVNQQISSASATYSSDGTSCTVSFSAQNLGKEVDWSDIEILYYIMKPEATSTYTITDCSATLNGSTAATLSVSQESISPALEGATNCIHLKVSDGSSFDTLDNMDFTFVISSTSELVDKLSSYGFQYSHSLSGAGYIAIYYQGDLIWGKVPETEADEEVVKTSTVDLVISACSTSVGDWNKLTLTVTLENQGDSYVNLKYVQLRYFYYLDNTDIETVTAYIYDVTVSTGIHELSQKSDDAIGFLTLDWGDDKYLAAGDTYTFYVDAWCNSSYGLSSDGISNSYSLQNGGALYYKGDLIDGSEPTGIKYGASDDGFPEYPETETPNNLSVTWYSCNANGAYYNYQYTISCDNLPDLDSSKWEVYLYQYYSSGTYASSTPAFTSNSTTASSYIVSYGTADDKGDDQYYVKLTSIVPEYSSSIYFDFQTYMDGMSGADTSKCYLPDGEYPILIYYDGELVWPTTLVNTTAGSSGSEDNGETGDEPTTSALMTVASGSSTTTYVLDSSKLSGLTASELASVTKIVADITVDSGYCNGTIGASSGGSWVSINGEDGTEINGSGETSGQFVLELTNGLDSYCEVQIWWVNPISESETGTATLTAITLYDSSGNVVAEF